MTKVYQKYICLIAFLIIGLITSIVYANELRRSNWPHTTQDPDVVEVLHTRVDQHKEAASQYYDLNYSGSDKKKLIHAHTNKEHVQAAPRYYNADKKKSWLERIEKKLDFKKDLPERKHPRFFYNGKFYVKEGEVYEHKLGNRTHTKEAPRYYGGETSIKEDKKSKKFLKMKKRSRFSQEPAYYSEGKFYTEFDQEYKFKRSNEAHIGGAPEFYKKDKSFFGELKEVFSSEGF